MGKITVNNIKIYAHHGCLNEETIIGSEYVVNISVWANLAKASVSDKLSDTVDYVLINAIVKEEMNIPAKLLERVADRILKRLFSEIEIISKASVSVSKLNPPIGGDVAEVTVRLQSKRSAL